MLALNGHSPQTSLQRSTISTRSSMSPSLPSFHSSLLLIPQLHTVCLSAPLWGVCSICSGVPVSPDACPVPTTLTPFHDVQPDAEGDTEVAPRRRGAMDGGGRQAGKRLFTGLWRHHYLSRAGDVIPIPMANDVSNCPIAALYGDGQTVSSLWTAARKLGTVGDRIF